MLDGSFNLWLNFLYRQRFIQKHKLVRVRYGNLKVEGGGGIDSKREGVAVKAAKIFPHCSWLAGVYVKQNPIRDIDIALIMLQKPIPSSSFHKPIEIFYNKNANGDPFEDVPNHSGLKGEHRVPLSTSISFKNLNKLSEHCYWLQLQIFLTEFQFN